MEDKVLYLQSCGYTAEEIAGQLGVPLDYVTDILNKQD